MVLDLRFTSDFDADLARLARRHPDWAVEVRDVVYEELRHDGCVAEAYAPHVLGRAGGAYLGCVEFHALDDVLVVYSPVRPKRLVTLRRICTHAELSAGVFGRKWPDE